MKRFLIFTLLFLGTTALSSCGYDDSPYARVSLQTKDITINGEYLTVEVAATPAQQQRGMGFRDSFYNDGMLFDMQRERVQSFWMKNTKISLDMVWITNKGNIIGFEENAEPGYGIPDSDLKHYSSNEPVRYVLELPAGDVVRRGITIGSTMEFPKKSREEAELDKQEF
jgi:uncharacterized protein